MRARICSALSCDVFARVVWLRLRRAAKPPTFALPFTAHTCHARLARLTRARGVSSQREGNALFDDFWYFSSRKSTIKEKFIYDTSLSEFFSLVRKERKGQKEECFPLLNTFCRLAATGANTLPRPSNYSIVTATGSKRSSADSDSLLCYVRLRRTSRLKFWCGTGCEHSEMRFITVVPSAHKLNSRPPCTYSGRADNACTNLLGSFVRYVRSRGSMKLRRVAKPPTFIFYRAARTCHALLLATNSCTRKEIFKRMENPLK